MRLLVVTFACIILAATEAGASVYKGKVKDAKTGEELIGATIFIKEYPNIGSTTGFTSVIKQVKRWSKPLPMN